MKKEDEEDASIFESLRAIRPRLSNPPPESTGGKLRMSDEAFRQLMRNRPVLRKLTTMFTDGISAPKENYDKQES